MADPRTVLIEARLERYAEQFGDPASAVLARFFGRYPDAKASFAHHAPHDPEKLETEMVGNTLYYLMTWFDSPVEARIYFDTSVPQHRVALGVPPDWYRAFIEATLDEIEEAVQPASAEESAAWAEVRDALVGLVERNRFV
ncbi:globin domain-containing protein [Novosphingobium aquiterrae]|uniref:Globin domain-containing protein n=1 Tax=Novosphingobium aquiterrae TaxID=624388 RepID=A0ABV6PHL6_9SPHN